jgi:hypothetical protein
MQIKIASPMTHSLSEQVMASTAAAAHMLLLSNGLFCFLAMHNHRPAC